MTGVAPGVTQRVRSPKGRPAARWPAAHTLHLQDISALLHLWDLHAEDSSITMLPGPGTGQSGGGGGLSQQVFVTLQGSDVAQRALTLHGTRVGARVVTVSLSSFAERAREIQRLVRETRPSIRRLEPRRKLPT